jgi:hypothetical protein
VRERKREEKRREEKRGPPIQLQLQLQPTRRKGRAFKVSGFCAASGRKSDRSGSKGRNETTRPGIKKERGGTDPRIK